jgi:hypothetical protein
MSEHCCIEEQILTNPCQALTDGVLTYKNFVTYGFTPWAFALLVAQCGANATLEEISDQLDTVITLLNAIDANTDELESLLADIIVELQDVNVNLGDIITELQAILVSVQNIDDNTDGIEAQLATIITLLTSIDNNTDGLEACCAAGNIILGNILTAITNPVALGAHVKSSGTQATPIAAGAYASWTIVRTNGIGSLVVDGLTVVNQGDATGDEAHPQRTVSEPTVVIAGGATYEWKAKT